VLYQRRPSFFPMFPLFTLYLPRRAIPKAEPGLSAS
jgi:hypothetical protein